MTEQIITIDQLRALTLTCQKCGVAFTFDITRPATIPDVCPTCSADWEDAGSVKAFRTALTDLRERDGGPLRVAFRVGVEA